MTQEVTSRKICWMKEGQLRKLSVNYSQISVSLLGFPLLTYGKIARLTIKRTHFMLLNFIKGILWYKNERWMGSYYHQYLQYGIPVYQTKIIYIFWNHATYILRFKIKAFQLNTGNEYSPHCLGKSRKCSFNLWESTLGSIWTIP